VTLMGSLPLNEPVGCAASPDSAGPSDRGPIQNGPPESTQGARFRAPVAVHSSTAPNPSVANYSTPDPIGEGLFWRKYRRIAGGHP